MKYLAGLFTLLICTDISGQEISAIEEKAYNFRSDFFVTWGYNRSQFSKSDIELKGNGYQFTLHDVVAKDRPSPFEAKVYFNPAKISIPQFNIRAGYFLNENISLSIGYDHMKYVAITNQQTFITGFIDSSASLNYAGVYDNSPITFSRDFLQYEHTNGCNYISFESDYYFHIWRSSNNNYSLSANTGAGIGIMVPRSDVSVFGVQGANLFHIAGFGTSLSVGIRLTFYNHFYLQFLTKGGFINLPDVLTYKLQGYNASQKFWFLQEIGNIGFRCELFKNKIH